MHVKNWGKRNLSTIIAVAVAIMFLIFLTILFSEGDAIREETGWIKTLFAVTGIGGTVLLLWGLYLAAKKELREVRERKERIKLLEGVRRING